MSTSSSLAAPVFYPTYLANAEWANPVFDWHGGVLMQSPPQKDAVCRRIGYDEDPNALAMEWETSAPVFELMCAPTGGFWRVMVRDVSASPWTVLGQWSSAGWRAAQVQVLSDATGARRARRFRVEYANQLA